MPDYRTTRKEGQASFTAAAYERLHHEIANATLAPGEKLLIREICERYGMGLSPVREALNRLSGERLVVHNEQRGFIVAPLSEPDLDDIVRARCWVNELGLRESIAHGDSDWEERVVIACHRLSRIPRFVGQNSVERNPAWEEAHFCFHQSLVSACGSAWLQEFCEQLFHAFARYRHLARMAALASPLHNYIEHSEIMQATTSRNTGEALRLLNEHFTKTALLVRKQLADVNAISTESSRLKERENPRSSRRSFGGVKNADREDAS